MESGIPPGKIFKSWGRVRKEGRGSEEVQRRSYVIPFNVLGENLHERLKRSYSDK